MGGNMARGIRKSLEDKIAQKSELIQSLEIRLDKERAELDEMMLEQKRQELDGLYEFIKNSSLSVEEATDILREHSESFSEE